MRLNRCGAVISATLLKTGDGALGAAGGTRNAIGTLAIRNPSVKRVVACGLQSRRVLSWACKTLDQNLL
jgi:hypothetical protein